MRIVIATPLYPPEIGGPATYTKELESELLKRGVDVKVVRFSEIRHLPKGIRHIRYLQLTVRALRTADVLYAQDTLSVGFPAYVASIISRKPFIVRVPGDQVWEQAQQRFGCRESIDVFPFFSWRWHPYLMFLRFLQNIVVRSAKSVIVPSKYFAKIVTHWHVSSDRIHVVYNGINLPLPLGEKPKNLYTPTIITVARLVPWKGVGALIEMLGNLPDWHLLIVGDGPLRKSLEQQSYNNNLSERVHFTGALSSNLVLGWYQTAEVFVLNTSFESFSFQVLEAMASGIPIITTNVGSLPELIENGEEGILVQPNDTIAIEKAIESLHKEPDIWESRTHAARKKAGQFSIQKTTDTVLEVINSISRI